MQSWERCMAERVVAAIRDKCCPWCCCPNIQGECPECCPADYEPDGEGHDDVDWENAEEIADPPASPSWAQACPYCGTQNVPYNECPGCIPF